MVVGFQICRFVKLKIGYHPATFQLSQLPGSSSEKNVKKWFAELGKIAGEVSKDCLNLPTSDKIRKLEKNIQTLSQCCKRTKTEFKSFKKYSNGMFARLTNKIKALEKNFSKRISQQVVCPNPIMSSSALAGKIQNGVVSCEGKKVGHRCKVTCRKGSYSYPTDSTVCTIQGIWKNDMPACKRAKSCKDVLRYNPTAKSGLYSIWNKAENVQYDVYCEMDSDHGGWTLAAVIANGDAQSWTYDDKDRDYGDLSSLWENSATLGNVNVNTPKTAKDFKSMAYLDVSAKELLITFKGRNYIQTDATCLGGHSLKQLFNQFRFSCAGSSYNCYYGKCLNTGGNGLSSLCSHQCSIARFYRGNGAASEPLSNGKQPSKLYFKAGEAEKAQDGNKDRVYISTFPYRNNVDYVPGLGSFTSLGGKKSSFDIGKHDDVSKPVSDKTLYYALFVR